MKIKYTITNYLQAIFNLKLFQTSIKNAKQQGLGLVDQNLQNKGGKKRAQRSECRLRTANQN